MAVNVTSPVTVPPGAGRPVSPTFAVTVPRRSSPFLYSPTKMTSAESNVFRVDTNMLASPPSANAHSMLPLLSGLNTVSSPPLSRVSNTSSKCRFFGETLILIISLSLISSPDLILTLPRCRTLISAAFSLSIL